MVRGGGYVGQERLRSPAPAVPSEASRGAGGGEGGGQEVDKRRAISGKILAAGAGWQASVSALPEECPQEAGRAGISYSIEEEAI